MRYFIYFNNNQYKIKITELGNFIKIMQETKKNKVHYEFGTVTCYENRETLEKEY
jgi:hypothetical protein